MALIDQIAVQVPLVGRDRLITEQWQKVIKPLLQTPLGPTYGGTGIVSYSQGDMLYSSASNTLAALPKTGTASYLSNGGTSNNPAWTAKAALTKTDDTNVTLTLGGTPTTALLAAASITAGWTGTLSVARGGSGQGTLAPALVASTLTSGRVVLVDGSGRLVDDADLSFSTDTLTVTKIAATTHTGDLTFADSVNVITNATTGTKIGTATNQKIGFWNAAPIVQPTTGVAAATFVANTSGIVDNTATFDGYTIGQVVKALRNAGLLA